MELFEVSEVRWWKAVTIAFRR